MTRASAFALAALLLLTACITETPPPSSPLIWFSGPRPPDSPRVGTVDRERVVEALHFHTNEAAAELHQICRVVFVLVG